MWKVFRRANKLAILATCVLTIQGVEAHAADSLTTGFNLPGVQLPHGHDEVRAADGTTCRTAVSGSGAYLDVGVIGNPGQSTTSLGTVTETDSSLAAYGRMVIPLGKRTPRIDCSRLYDLEVQRLAMELKLMQMGLTRGIAPVSEVSSSHDEEIDISSSKPIKLAQNDTDSWADDGWSTEGLKK